ncbi:hypothetical protein [Streptomyces sp. NPDC050848]|uniref:hypothetical protein n=1 Tax=Streptomyces sp. NPDC050848 TaxID=3155791 RepID=UPI00340F2F00
MSEWGIALIAAGSAILGSITTGFFAWKAGHRQAAAAEAAGQAQANALIATVQATLDEQRRTRAVDQRRQVYVQLLEVRDRQIDGRGAFAARGSSSTSEDVRAALSLVELEGPDYVAAAAHAYVDLGARAAYIEAVRRALDET